MAITFPSLSEAKATVAGYFQTLLTGWDLSSKSAFGKVKAALTLTVYNFLSTARQIDRDAVPTSATSTEGLNEWAENGTGISDGGTGYGRKNAIEATGGIGQFSGTVGTVFASGAALTASDGVTKFMLLGGVTIGTTANDRGSIDATTAGLAGNLDVGATLSVDSVPIGGTSTVVLTTATAGGLDQESNAAVLARIQGRLRNPPKGGTAHDYKVWAEDDAGVDNITARIFPRRQGTGSVDAVVYYTTQTGTARRVTSGDLSTIDTYIESVRPVTVESANTLTPTMTSGEAVSIWCRVTPAPGFEFDFDDTQVSYPYVISGGMSSGLRIAGRPASGLLVGDRIQVANTASGAPVCPEQRTVTAIDLATISGNTILTLSSGLTVYPNSGNLVYAGGPVVAAVASGVLGLVDSLGPSKAAGYASDSDSWDDTLRVDQIIRVALNTADATSGRMLYDFVSDPVINSGSVNVTPTDNLSTAPAMLWATRINITQ